MSSVVLQFAERLQFCEGAMRVEKHFHNVLKCFDSSLLFAAESALLKVASYEQCASGIFYATLFGDESGDVYVR